MKNFIKKILLICLCLMPIVSFTSASNNIPPSYKDNFSKYFTNDYEDKNGEIVDVYHFDEVSADKSLKDNIRCLFYPSSYSACSGVVRGGSIRGLLRYIGYVLIVLFIIIAGINLLVNGSKPDKVKSALSSLLFIILGSLFYFGAIWILGSVLQFETVQGTAGLTENIQGNSNSLLFFLLSFMKAFAFIGAIIMMVVHGFKMMSNADKGDKVKAGIKGILNVIVALVIIKIIDYVYYIAQLPDLVAQATTLIIEIAKIIGFVIGALMVIMLFYAGFLLITDQGSSKNMEKAKNIIVGLIVTAVVVFSLLLIIYELFNEFA